ncbi:L,D-transpeptidase [Corynebacterium felinum]
MRNACIGVAFSIVLAAGTACTIDKGVAETAKSTPATTSTQAPKLLAPQISVKDGATDVNPNQPVVVKSLGEGLSSVRMTNEEGKVIESTLDTDNMRWTTAEQLGFNRTYTVEAKDKNGKTATVTFSTVQTAALSSNSLAPLDGAEVGVGQTIALRFDTFVNNRKDVEKAITVTTVPKVEGAFYWISNQEVRWRPENYWKPGTKVTVDAKLYGVKIGEGVYVGNDNKASFTIGEKVEAIVDDNTKTMTVYKSGEQVKSMPVSLGSAQWPTPNGVYIIGDQYPSLVMDSTTYGLSLENGGYKTPVQFATQMSYSGIFVHAAPWSLWAQGSQNVSHGCVNVSTENAQWFQNFVKRGDLVTVKNTIGQTLSGYDGLGDWNIDWETWKKGNADQA